MSSFESTSGLLDVNPYLLLRRCSTATWCYGRDRTAIRGRQSPRSCEISRSRRTLCSIPSNAWKQPGYSMSSVRQAAAPGTEVTTLSRIWKSGLNPTRETVHDLNHLMAGITVQRAHRLKMETVQNLNANGPKSAPKSVQNLNPKRDSYHQYIQRESWRLFSGSCSTTPTQKPGEGTKPKRSTPGMPSLPAPTEPSSGWEEKSLRGCYGGHVAPIGKTRNGFRGLDHFLQTANGRRNRRILSLLSFQGLPRPAGGGEREIAQMANDDFYSGVRACLDLTRAGASADEIEAAIPAGDPVDLDAYQARLRELRTLMNTDGPDLFGADEFAVQRQESRQVLGMDDVSAVMQTLCET